MEVNGIIQGKGAAVAQSGTAGGPSSRKENSAAELFQALLDARSESLGSKSVEVDLHRKMLRDMERSSSARKDKAAAPAPAPAPARAAAPEAPKPRERERTDASGPAQTAAPARPSEAAPQEPSAPAVGTGLVEASTLVTLGAALTDVAPVSGTPGDPAAGGVTGGPAAPVDGLRAGNPDAMTGTGTPADTAGKAALTQAQAATEAPAPAAPEPVPTEVSPRADRTPSGPVPGTVAGTATAPSGTSAQTADPAVQAQAADLARSLDADSRLDVRVRVTDQGARGTAARSAEADTARPVAEPASSGTDTGGQQTARDGSGLNRSPAQQTVVQQAQASNLGQNTNPAAAATQGPASFEKLLAERQAAAKPEAARTDALRTEARKAETAATVRQAAGTASATSSAPAAGAARAGAGAEIQSAQMAAPQSSGRPSDVPQVEQATRTAPRSHTPAQARAVIDQVRVNITKALDRGMDEIRIQLRPASLGRVEVKMDLSSETGQVRAAIIVDRPETLEMLRSDQRTLERALQDAGLKTDSNGLSFELRSQQNDEGGRRQGAGGPGRLAGMDDADAAADEAVLLQDDMDQQRLARARARGGVDVRV
ncbi:flagellar hook-length control protein FliK [Phaeovibrio sulfidiphilus]|uniref:Flagellar hook-length control protein FliK n=1 Tax=Phaeovibrio sulfidiphilus TaxID=1220600 RepID=A0A8J6YKR7_9PROT|nr:flagellar hook-length control protein FliK [Phaeovibrio sulfidiphilus]MBE1236080.1 flagellar hook-length control protein FliK [Phaeovibrio sulfidiphilus]